MTKGSGNDRKTVNENVACGGDRESAEMTFSIIASLPSLAFSLNMFFFNKMVLGNINSPTLLLSETEIPRTIQSLDINSRAKALPIPEDAPLMSATFFLFILFSFSINIYLSKKTPPSIVKVVPVTYLEGLFEASIMFP
jgi:hypothetical protein